MENIGNNVTEEQDYNPEGTKASFFDKRYFSEENYGIPGGYETYDNDGFWRSAVKSMEKYSKNLELEEENYLDLGCAFGHLLKRSPFTHIFGADISLDPALKRAQQALKEEGKTYNTLVQLDADENLPYSSNSFGCVTALDIIEHTKDRRHTVQEISRVMKDNGILIVGTPITDTTEGKFWGKYLDRDKSHISKPTREELFADIESSGLEVLEYRYYFPLTHAKVPFPRTNIEIVAIKSGRTSEELRDIHKERFKTADFLRSA